MADKLDLTKAKNLFPKRFLDSNKSTYGKILNISGSRFYQGAAYLSSVSALKVGAGYITLACPDCILNNIASLSPDITFLPLRSFNNESIASDNAKNILEKVETYDSISIGCGLSTNSSTLEFVDKFLQGFNSEIPIVIDADGLNSIATLQINKLPKNSIITPHPKELSRLLEISVKEINNNREEVALSAAKKFNTTVILKGHNTVIADYKGNSHINTTGNSSLAKAGSGDVLTGLITGLLAQGMGLEEGAVLATFLHGLCGELAGKELTEYSTLASDLIEYIPQAMKLVLTS